MRAGPQWAQEAGDTGPALPPGPQLCRGRKPPNPEPSSAWPKDSEDRKPLQRSPSLLSCTVGTWGYMQDVYSLSKLRQPATRGQKLTLCTVGWLTKSPDLECSSEGCCSRR